MCMQAVDQNQSGPGLLLWPFIHSFIHSSIHLFVRRRMGPISVRGLFGEYSNDDVM